MWFQVGQICKDVLTKKLVADIKYARTAIAHFTEIGNEKEVELYTKHLEKLET